LYWTIPPAIFLTVLSYPFLTRVNVWQITVMVLVAFFATVPWDSYLIKIGVWTYPPEAVIGPTWQLIPIEELFFFIIQTYITSVFAVLMNKPLLHAQYLIQTKLTKTVSHAILALFAGAWLLGCAMFVRGGNSTYMGILLAWALPFATIAWYFSGAFFLSLPTISVLGPILIPTFYLWIVDALALGRGTWSIESGTKLEVYLFGSFDIEEATFFLLTNVLITFGIVGSSHALAICHAFPVEFPELPPPMNWSVIKRFLPSATHDETRIEGFRQAVDRLQKKSRSFYLASSAFSGRLRIDLILL
jgi:15-cis-phytoene synthase / lycopene beta-cyclase